MLVRDFIVKTIKDLRKDFKTILLDAKYDMGFVLDFSKYTFHYTESSLEIYKVDFDGVTIKVFDFLYSDIIDLKGIDKIV